MTNPAENISPEENQTEDAFRRALPVSLTTSSIFHILFILPTISFAVQDAIDPDLLGLRGGRQWAETIQLTETPPSASAPYPTLEVRIVTALPRVKDEKREKHEPNDPQKSSADEDAPIKTEAPRVPEDHADTPAEAQNPHTKTASAAPNLAMDAIGQNEGGANNNAEGAFVSGDDIKLTLSGWTLRGSNGFLDGSISAAKDQKRQSIKWRVYYARSGHLRARFSRLAAAYPHGPRKVRAFSSSGRWWIKGDRLCQKIEDWFYGAPICFEIRRKGKALAMYYAECWGVTRCYRGRLGPEGVILKGRRLN